MKKEDVFSDIEEEFMDQDESIAAPEQTQLENERLDLKELKREDVFSDIEEEFMDQETKKEDIFSDIEVGNTPTGGTQKGDGCAILQLDALSMQVSTRYVSLSVK